MRLAARHALGGVFLSWSLCLQPFSPPLKLGWIYDEGVTQGISQQRDGQEETPRLQGELFFDGGTDERE